MKKSFYFLVLIVMFFSSMGFAQSSNWEWQNPLPAGNPLANIHVFDANTAITVGNAGSILKTTDGGNNWFSCTSGTNESLNSVEFVDSNTGWVVGTKGTILKTTDGGTTWSIQPTGILIELTSVSFLNSNTGWVAGDAGWVMKTIDGGINWTVQVLEPGYTYDLYDVQFINSNEGWVSAKGGRIWKTTDGGLTWTSVIVNASSTSLITSIHFIDSNTGWAVGGENPSLSIIVKTTDGGLTWIPQTSGVTDMLYSVYFADINTGWAVGSYSSNTILKTIDGGANWFTQTTLPSGGFSKSIRFANSNTGWVVGEAGRIFKTTDGGTNWLSQVRSVTSESQILYCVDFKNINIGWAVGLAGKILKTTDGGTTWISQTSGVTTDLKSVSFINLTTGWVVGKSGTILKTTDGGTSWSSQTSGTTNDLNDIFFINETTGWVVGQSGVVRKTANGGSSWTSQTSSVTSHLNSVCFVDINKGWAVGAGGKVIRTTNGGTSWTNLTVGATTNIYYSVHFINSTAGIMVGSGGRIYKTTTSGGNWLQKTSSTALDLYSVHSADGINLRAVGKTGVIRMSNDGGNFWTEEFSGTVTDLWSVFFANENTGWIVGTNGTVLTKRKGSIWTGFADNSWTDATNWTDGVPLEGSNAIIAATANQPTITTTVSLYNLSISPGAALTISPAAQVTVTNLLTNSSMAQGLVVQSGGSLITNGTVSGLATVESALNGGNWHLISAPVSGALSDIFLNKYLQAHSEASNQYADIELPTTALTPMRGFAAFNTTDFTAQYVGPLNSGVLSADLTRSALGANSGWNLVGNPYPSSIDWNAASGWTKTNTMAATYIHVNSSTWASYVAGVGANGGSQYIAPGQGFFVQVTDGLTTGVLGMTNGVRVHNATPFFKSEVTNLVRLAVSGNGYTDEAVVRILPEATTEFDGDYDAVKLFGDVADAAQLYSLGRSELAINATPSKTPVQVGMRVGKSGKYTIAASEVNDLAYVTLEDTKTGKFTDLKKGSHSFDFSEGENEQRFVLHFDQLPVNSINSIYSVKSTVHVDLQNAGDIYIYSVTGQLVVKAKGNVGENKFNLANAGNYIVKVVFTEASPLTKKVSVL